MSLGDRVTRVRQKVERIKVYITSSRKRQRLSAVIIILAIAGIGQVVYSSFAATGQYSNIPQVAKMQQLTEEVTRLTDEYAAMPDMISGTKGRAQPNQSKANKKQELIKKVDERKVAVVEAMKYDPFAVAKSILPEAVKQKLPKEINVQKEIENLTAVKGYYEVGIIEPKDHHDGNPKQFVSIASKNGPTRVYAKNLPSDKVNLPVEAKGVVIGGSIGVLSKAQAEELQSGSSPITLLWNKLAAQFWARKAYAQDANAPNLVFCPDAEDKEQCSGRQVSDSLNKNPIIPAVGTMNVLVVPINFAEDTSVPLRQDGSPIDLNDINNIFNGQASARDMLNTMSYGRLNANFVVRPQWLTIPADKHNNVISGECDSGDYHMQQIDRDVFEVLAASGERLNTYSQTLFLYNNLRCYDSGLGVQFSGYSGVYGQGVAPHPTHIKRAVLHLMTDHDPSTRVNQQLNQHSLKETAVHELGHALGINHARAGCDDQCPAIKDSWNPNYGDPYSLMGDEQPGAGHFSAFHKWQLGWLDDSQIENVDYLGQKRVMLNPVSGNSGISGKRAIRINPSPAYISPYDSNQIVKNQLYIELRQPTDFIDNFLEPSSDGRIPEAGILIHEVNFDSGVGFGSGGIGPFPASTKILNGNDRDYLGAALKVGETYIYKPTKVYTGQPNGSTSPPEVVQTCIKVESMTTTSAEVSVTFNCNSNSLEVQSTLGQYDNDMKMKGEKDPETQLSDVASHLEAPQGMCKIGDKLFVLDRNRVVQYTYNDFEGVEYGVGYETATGLISAPYDRYVSGWEDRKTMASNSTVAAKNEWRPVLPDGSLVGQQYSIACDEERGYLFVHDYLDQVDRLGKILVYDVSNGLKDNLMPIRVIGQDRFTYAEPQMPLNVLQSSTQTRAKWQTERFFKQRTTSYAYNDAKSFRNVHFMYYSKKQKRLYVNDISFRRILVYDMANGVTNDMPARWVLGQPSFTSTLVAGTTSVFNNNVTNNSDWFGSLAFDEETETLFTMLTYRHRYSSTNTRSRPLIVAYDTSQITNGEQPIFRHQTGEYYLSQYSGPLMFDSKQRRLVLFGSSYYAEEYNKGNVYSFDKTDGIRRLYDFSQYGKSILKSYYNNDSGHYFTYGNNGVLGTLSPQIRVHQGLPQPANSANGALTSR